MTGWVSQCFTSTPVLGCCALLGLSRCSSVAWIATINGEGEDSGRAQRLLLAVMPSVVLPTREPVLALLGAGISP